MIGHAEIGGAGEGGGRQEARHAWLLFECSRSLARCARLKTCSAVYNGRSLRLHKRFFSSTRARCRSMPGIGRGRLSPAPAPRERPQIAAQPSIARSPTRETWQLMPEDPPPRHRRGEGGGRVVSSRKDAIVGEGKKGGLTSSKRRLISGKINNLRTGKDGARGFLPPSLVPRLNGVPPNFIIKLIFSKFYEVLR